MLEQGTSAVAAYGQVDGAGGGDSLFEVGSITKLFTTALLSSAIEEGLVSLDDPVRKHLPELSNLPPELTLLRLATHTAGLPKMPGNILRSMLQDRRNPYANYSTQDLLRYLSRYGPKHKFGAADRINYSNLGAALLGYILAQVLETSYEEAVVGRLCNALGLADTRITLNPNQKQRLAPPHSARGRPGRNWDLPAFAGAGALYSTANDLLRFLAANLGHHSSPLTNILQACHETQAGVFPPPGRLQELALRLSTREPEVGQYRQGVGLGWVVGHLSSGPRVCWHHGATGGYRAFAGFVEDSKTGVVVLGNTGPGRADVILGRTWADEIGFKVLEHLNA
jgi:CubicO group peptidase (beta-lactamase class C family)